jgi:TonB family protein
MAAARGLCSRFGARILTLPALAVLVVLIPSLAFASEAAPPPASILTAPDLYGRLAGADRIEAFRLEGDYDGICDSLVLEGGSSLDCFVRSAEVRFESQPYLHLILRLMDCDWTPSALAWTSPAAPTIGFAIETDSSSVGLLLSIRAMKATLSSPGVGSVACVIPERMYREVMWCLWQIDPENPEVAPGIHAELLRLGLDPDSEPEDVSLEEVVAEEVSEEDAPGEFSPPYPIVPPHPDYPAFARAVGAHGVVVVRVLVGIDGRVKDMDIVRSVFGLDQAARWAVLQCPFHPGRRGERPVEAWTEVDVPFPLEEPK